MKLLNIKSQNKKYKFVPKSKDNTLRYYNKEKIIKRRSHASFEFHSILKKVVKLGNALFLPVLILAILSVLYLVFFKLDTFKIKNVSVQGAKKYVSYNDLQTLVQNKALGQNIFLFNSQQLNHVLTDTFLGAKTIEVDKNYPNKISIVVNERVPTALLYKEDKNQAYIVDTDGFVLGPADTALALPRIKYQGNIKVGTFIDSKLIPAYFELMSDINDQKIKVSSISFYPRYMQLYVDNATQVNISSDKSISDSLKLFTEVYKQLSLQGKKVSKVDLRYDKVIVSYE
ncbi:MAG TPA: FtsQ-type POTRA domain-containing protein [Candidatus Saccharimonadales bacterium]|nr:FtsQ-type POTRA domain-containing protein [Candidatus Saccharimonadales bacterium]